MVTLVFSQWSRSGRVSLRGLPERQAFSGLFIHQRVLTDTRGCKGASPCRGFRVTKTLLAIDKSIGIWGESKASQLTFSLIDYGKHLVT